MKSPPSKQRAARCAKGPNRRFVSFLLVAMLMFGEDLLPSSRTDALQFVLVPRSSSSSPPHLQPQRPWRTTPTMTPPPPPGPSRPLFLSTTSRRRRFGLAAAVAKSDPFREGIRPSLHPVTINAVAEALRVRATTTTTTQVDSWDGDPTRALLQVSEIATTALAKRQQASTDDGMRLTRVEEQTVVGRVVGVVLRVTVLETLLYQQCRKAAWIAKYHEWDSFGILATEDNDDELSSTTSDAAVRQRTKDDPLWRLARAECLLALFLETVERPGLEQTGESVPDGSVIDFLDEDRKQVLLG